MTNPIFVYAKEGRIKCVAFDCSLEGQIEREHDLQSDGWHHTATIDPCAWIEHLMNDGLDPSDVMDELNFGPSSTTSPLTTPQPSC